ncbi:MAG: hypothetical protein KDD40_01970 [Bdellovibrionales bacterium]|nr:hypothetical protein [Bdellovibrionales bacterium]
MINFVKIFFLPVFILACSNGTPEVTRLTSLSGIEFKGSTSTSVVFTQLTTPVDVEGSCDRSTDSLLLSVDNGKSWNDGKSLLGSRLEIDCRKNSRVKFTFLTDNKGLFQFQENVASEHQLKIIARAGKDSAQEAAITLSYQPENIPPVPVANSFVLPAAGAINGATYKMKYRVKSANVKSDGTIYRLKTIK